MGNRSLYKYFRKDYLVPKYLLFFTIFKIVMRVLQYIKNQYDNEMHPMEWSDKAMRQFMHVIQHPLVVEKKDMIPQWKFCTVKGTKRQTENIDSTDVLILDFDSPTYTINEFESTFRNFMFILHTSHSYDGTNQKFRVFLFLDKEYDIQLLFFKGHNEAFSPYHFMLKYFPMADKASFTRAQFFKMPAIKEKGAPYYYKINNGVLFNPFKELGYEFKLAYELCQEKQAEYLLAKKKQNEMFRKLKGDMNLDNAKKYLGEKIENAPSGERHNVIFSCAAWFKRIGGTYDEFTEVEPSWADRAYYKQIRRLASEWDRLG